MGSPQSDWPVGMSLGEFSSLLIDEEEPGPLWVVLSLDMGTWVI